MPLGPVFRHEMLAAGRKRRYFFGVVLVGLAMLVLLGIGYAIVSQTSRYQANGVVTTNQGGLSIAGVARLTATFYIQFAWATMFGVLLITPAVAAGAIATERERRTIDYLFATDLSNAEIVLDKLAARLLVVAKLVVATLPVLAIFRLLGGVPGSLLLIHFAMLASTATLVASIALTVGVWCDRARDAVPRALGAVFLWLVAWPVAMGIAGLVSQYATARLADWVMMFLYPIIHALQLTNPLFMLATAAGVSGGTLGVDLDLRAVGWMIGAQLVAAALLLGVCVLMVRRVHLRSASKSTVKIRRSKRAPSSRTPYEHRPMLWKEMFAASIARKGSRWSKRLGVTVLVLLIAGPLVMALFSAWAYSGGRYPIQQYAEVAGVMSTLCGSIVLLLMGARAAGLISHEREQETWLTLLTTPLTAEEILAAKAGGNFYAFRWPIAGVLLISLAGVLLSFTAVVATVGVLAVMISVGWAATAIGLAYSLRMKSSVKAVGAAIFTLLGIGLFYSLVAMMFVALAGGGEGGMALFVAPPCVPMLLAVPVIFLAEGLGGGEAWLVISYVAGLAFYCFLGFTVSRSNASVFDKICERGIGKLRSHPPTPTAALHPDTHNGPLPPAAMEA